jgi:hypothetical protein
MSPTRYVVEYMLRRSPVASSLRWVVRYQVATEAFWRRSKERYSMLRCEDFIAEPRRRTIRRILELAWEETTLLPHVAEHEVKIGVNHNIWGNPSGFQTGTVEIRPEQKVSFSYKTWRQEIEHALNFPLLVRYRAILWPLVCKLVPNQNGEGSDTLEASVLRGQPGGPRAS